MKTTQTPIVFAAALVVAAIGALGLIGCSTSQQSNAPKGVDRYVKAVQAYNSGDRERAIANLMAATRINPDLIMARALLGDLYRSAGQYENAASQYEVLVKLDPYTALNFYKLGVSYQFLQRLQEAADAYQKALKLDPDDPNSNMNLGLVNLYLGNPDDAVRYCERATLLDPKSAAAFSNLGVALDARGEFSRAEAAYRHSLDLDPENTTTLLNLGTNLIAQKKGGEAVDMMERVLKASDTPLHRKRYGDALAGAGRYDDAIREYQLALKLDPKYYPAMNEIGWSQIAQYKNNLELDEAQRQAAVEAWYNSIAVYPEQPKIQAAIEEYNKKALFRQ